MIGPPLATSRLAEERLSKLKALPIFASDALSSTAYATEEILLVLVLATTVALTWSIPISIAIVALMAIVTISYRETVRAYPQGGGAYKVALENLGVAPGLVAGSALIVGYVLTVAVSTAAGVAAVTSAVPELHDAKIPLSLTFVALLTLGNLRGVRESGTIFAIPTYFFIASFGLMILVGLGRAAFGGIEYAPPGDAAEFGGREVTLLLVLRAFSSGATALTGIEAISNGVPSFEPPSSRNAATTLGWMAAILGTMFIGITVLSHNLDIQPSETRTVVSQVADAVFDGGPLFYIVQGATALILVLAANTSFAGLPSLISAMARDGYAPHVFTFRGDRLGYSNGIMALALASAALLILFNADTHRLIPLYALGVFVGFTLSQLGMVVHWRRHPERGWRRSMAINLAGAATTGLVMVIVGATRLVDGAWITMAAIAITALFCALMGLHYRDVKRRLAVDEDEIFVDLGAGRHGQPVILPVDDMNRATLRAVSYARSISDNVTAIHVTGDMQEADDLRTEWERHVLDVPLVVVESEFRSLLGPMLSFVDKLDHRDPGQVITVVLPEYVTRWPWQQFLHNQSSRRLKHALVERPNTVIIEVPYHLSVEESLETTS
ncbi:MAG: APC family permease [Dehalococcoidia bacterium]